MAENNRVAWEEGLFLRPQHFQQAERFIEKLVGDLGGARFPYGFGFLKLEIDQELAKLGKVGLSAASGVFPDGTPFDLPFDADIPVPVDVPDNAKDVVVSLVVPLRRPNMPSFGLERSPANALVRYYPADVNVRDAIAEMDSLVDLKVARLNLGLRLNDEISPAYTTLGVVRIAEKRPDGRVVFADNYFPPVLDCRAVSRLFDYVAEVHGLLRHRAQALAERVSQPGSKGVAEFADFLLLQLCNRLQPLFAHFATRALLHPETLYSQLLELAGELGTFARKDRRSPDFKPYQHDALWDCFEPLIDEVRRGLTAILESSAVAVPIEDLTQGYFVGRVQDVDLLRAASFVLAVNAQIPPDTLRQRFPREAQIGSRERIRALVDAQLPGIVLRPMPVAPRQIPYHAGYTYFELEKARRPGDQVDYWKEFEAARMIVMHVAGDFPELNLQLWAIRND